MGVREERRLAAREGILAAAHRQIAEAGLASASMTTVAARAGVATGSLYRHFPSRGELLSAVVGDALRGEQALLDRATAAAPDLPGALRAWVRTAVTRAREAPGLTHALLHESTEPPVAAARHAAAEVREAALARLLRTGAEHGAWLAGPAELQAVAILGAIEAVVSGPTADRRFAQGPAPGAAAAELSAFALRALAAPAGSS